MIIDQPWIFSGWHTLKPGEALRQVRDLLATNPTSELTLEFRAELLWIIESTPTETPGDIDYASLDAHEFNALKPGEAPILWLAEKGIVPEWKAWNFKWSRHALPDISPESKKRFSDFCTIAFQDKKIESFVDNTPEDALRYSLIVSHDAYNVIGIEHFIKIAQPQLERIHREYPQFEISDPVEVRWQKDAERRRIIEVEFGLVVNEDWSNLPGLRDSAGTILNCDSLYALGAPHNDNVQQLLLNKHGSTLGLGNHEVARLCFLA